uniref:Interleukin n=1 Tax=Cyprinodon variegatus TaxID=28743 RepID=A0A3Q2EIC2_CYPVA
MEHLMKIAFWIFTFSATLSGCNPVPKLHMSDFRIDFMDRSVTCAECFTSALECIFKELGVAAHDCHGQNEHIMMGLGTLKLKIDQLKEKSSTLGPTSDLECVCEAWDQANFTVFLNNYETLLQEDNTRYLEKNIFSG